MLGFPFLASDRLKNYSTSVDEINKFLAGETRPRYLVVCSRIEEYSSYSSNLHLSGAISLRELNETQILEYFEAVGQVEFWQTLQRDEALLKLMETPLFLSITVLSVQELSIEDWQRLETMEERIEHLFDAYWQQQMFNRNHAKELYVIKNRLRFFLDKYIRRKSVEPGIEPYIQQKPPNPEQTRMWLVWLAQQMQRELETEFLIEEIQPSLLKTKIPKTIYKLIVLGVIQMLIFGLIYGLIGLIYEMISGLFYGLMGLIFGLIYGLFSVLISELIPGLIYGLHFGLINLLALIYVLRSGLLILISWLESKLNSRLIELISWRISWL